MLSYQLPFNHVHPFLLLFFGIGIEKPVSIWKFKSKTEIFACRIIFPTTLAVFQR